ncbi:MAG TPA: DUF5129 domain-containing protein [Candidatus Corynebacterium intestinavium]|uniref:DUF5129 domain-containing protein n=1 Tax=Candidatus Corynebacterium intestinavium TaxID=2838531 RepID=A0A9D2UAX6_9CORY|nr:DUF5129 domain-containing protein [Candidatus Corynebacterium intestinavium]
MTQSRRHLFTPQLALIGIACAGLTAWSPAGASAAEQPAPPAVTIQAQAAPTKAQVDVEIADESGVLGNSARESLQRQTEAIDFPDSVQKVVYLLIPGQDENFNEDALNWAEARMPELIPDGAGKGATWADGVLILGVGTSTRTNGVYCGNDVCQQLDLFEGAHLDASLEAMKDGFRRNNFGMGLAEGARVAADLELGQRLAEEQARRNRNVRIGFGVAGVGAAGVGAAWWQRRKKRLTATAKQQFDDLSKNYVTLSQRLDELDIRAHSLSSPLANAELRSQWEAIRDDFLGLNRRMDSLGLTLNSEDKEFYEKHKEIASAHDTLESMSNAEDNINLMFELENGDVVKRERELVSIKQDISEALFQVHNYEAVRQLQNVERQVNELLNNLEAADFMDRLARIVSDQAHALDLATRDMQHLDRAKHASERPALGDRNWRPGYVYSNWVPYYMLASWNAADTRAAQSASSSGSANTSFSSGFAGGGGSSSW